MTGSIIQRFSLILFLIISAITLVFGLKPHGNFKAEWVSPATANGFVEIGEYGYLQGDFPEFSSPIPNDESLDFLLTVTAQEQLDPNFRILLFIGNSCESIPMIIGQWRTQLIVLQGCDFPNKSKGPRLTAALDAHFGNPIDIVLSLNNDSSTLAINDSVMASNPVSVVNPFDTEGSLMLIGNSTDSRHGWSGLLSHFAIQRQLRPNDALKKDSKEPNDADDVSNGHGIKVLQNYTFSELTQHRAFTSDATGDETSDTTIEAIGNTSTKNQLTIPRIGKFPETVVLEPSPINTLLKNAKKDLILNFLGFAPFGLVAAMCLYYCLGIRGLMLIALSFTGAFILSLGIELSQVYIAGRRSALHDLILNTTGSVPGAVAFVVFVKLKEWVSKLSMRAI